MLRRSDEDLRVHGLAGENRCKPRLACRSGVHIGGALGRSDADPRVHGLAREDDDCKPRHVWQVGAAVNGRDNDHVLLGLVLVPFSDGAMRILASMALLEKTTTVSHVTSGESEQL
ncbi:hypothetical protein MRB53_004199 [Persea americana]|uniref:Uncharacterized protein n=1 Tax=Persea americana TaxID=3435 RepID=A0ACC2MZI3_PERAE|nr:hypothetical protein MRB53_004199 [Persea americana]